MTSKKRIFASLLCISTLLATSLTAMAQSKERPKTKDKTVTRTFIFKGDGGQVREVEGNPTWVGDKNQALKDGVHFQMQTAGDGLHFQEGMPNVEFISHEFSFDSKIVKGSPYTADAVTEMIQTLNDGNRIIRRSSAQISRDSDGRTRREQELKMIGPLAANQNMPRMVYINDPVAGVHYTLNPKDRSARKMTVDKIVHISDGKDVALKSTTSGPETVRVAVATTSGSEDLKFVTEDNKTIIFTKNEDGVSMPEDIKKKLAQVRGHEGETKNVFYFQNDDQVNSDRVKRESLARQSFEGVEAEGTRTTITIPAGEIGNELPIVTVYERWYSPQLQTVVMTRRSDPRSGETVYKLMNINRSEPDARMFQVPSDYTIKETNEIKIRAKVK